MSDHPCFSVVIPAYNYGHFLERAVRSVVDQGYPCCQLLVIDDGSTDDTPDVIQRMKNEGLAFDAVRQNNAGQSEVRNRGIRETDHDWLVFLDADDEMLPGGLAALAAAIQDNPSAAVIIAGHESVFPDGRCREVRPHPVTCDRIENLQLYLEKTLSINNGASTMHRRVFGGISYRGDLRHTEDMPVFAHAIANYDIATTDVPVARIYKHATSMRHDHQAARSVGMKLEEVLFQQSGLPEAAQSLRADYRSRRALSLLKLCHRSGDHEGVVIYFHEAFKAKPMRALSPRYLRRYLVSLWKR